MAKLQINKKHILESDKIIVIALKEDKQVQMHMHGQWKLEEILDSFNTVQHETLTTFSKHKDIPEKSRPALKKSIYERAVWGFSLMIDKFHPEGKDNRFSKLTDKAILKAQDDVLKKSTKSS